MPTVTDYYSARKETLPFVSGDSDIIVDIDFTQYTSVAEFEAANSGWTVSGTSGSAVFDANGFNGKGVAGIRNTTLNASALASANQGTILVEVEREAIADDESIASFSADFIQSTGTKGSTRYLFLTGGSATYFLSAFYQSNDVFRFRSMTNSVENSIDDCRFNSQTPSGLDGYFQVVTTWNNYEVWNLVDRVPCGMKAQSVPHKNANEFDDFYLGENGGAAQFLGDYYIRRLQIVKRSSIPAFMPVRWAVFGDSFMRSAVDTENHLTRQSIRKYFDGTGRSARYSGIQELSRLCESSGLGIPYGIYGASTTENGHGWASDLTQFSAATINAVVTADPEIIICAGSINDVGDTLPASLLVDMKAIMDTFIDGCPSLREIHYFQMFPGLCGSTTTNTALRYTNAAANMTEAAGIDGYRNMVIYHDTRADWDESYGTVSNPEYTTGSSPTNTKSTNNDVHPSPLGNLKMGEIINNALLKYIKRAITVAMISFLVVGAGNYITLGSENISVGFEYRA